VCKSLVLALKEATLINLHCSDVPAIECDPDLFLPVVCVLLRPTATSREPVSSATEPFVAVGFSTPTLNTAVLLSASAARHNQVSA
jgi:hypothetical protein